MCGSKSPDPVRERSLPRSRRGRRTLIPRGLSRNRLRARRRGSRGRRWRKEGRKWREERDPQTRRVCVCGGMKRRRRSGKEREVESCENDLLR